MSYAFSSIPLTSEPTCEGCKAPAEDLGMIPGFDLIVCSFCAIVCASMTDEWISVRRGPRPPWWHPGAFLAWRLRRLGTPVVIEEVR